MSATFTCICADHTYIDKTKLPSIVCLAICPDGTYGDDMTGYCESCNVACAKCTGASDTGDCSVCNTGYYL